MLTKNQIANLREVAKLSAVQAEETWSKVGDEFLLEKFSKEAETLTEAKSQIPGHPTVTLENPVVDTFVAMFVDIRGATNHLENPDSDKIDSGFQRVFYETSILLPCLDMVIREKGGGVTEYLGDGVLGLFRVDDKCPEKIISSVYPAADNCIDVVKSVVNPLIADLYHLPGLEIGVGMGYGKALVTLVGTPNFYHPKVIGRCVYNASKLADGINAIWVDNNLFGIWPKSSKGHLQAEDLPSEVLGRAFEIKQSSWGRLPMVFNNGVGVSENHKGIYDITTN